MKNEFMMKIIITILFCTFLFGCGTTINISQTYRNTYDQMTKDEAMQIFETSLVKSSNRSGMMNPIVNWRSGKWKGYATINVIPEPTINGFNIYGDCYGKLLKTESKKDMTNSYSWVHTYKKIPFKDKLLWDDLNTVSIDNIKRDNKFNIFNQRFWGTYDKPGDLLIDLEWGSEFDLADGIYIIIPFTLANEDLEKTLVAISKIAPSAKFKRK